MQFLIKAKAHSKYQAMVPLTNKQSHMYIIYIIHIWNTYVAIMHIIYKRVQPQEIQPVFVLQK